MAEKSTYPELIWFEDFFVGQEFRYGGHEMKRQAMVDFARTYDPEPFHLDEAAAIDMGWDGLIASGPMIGVICRRMTFDPFPQAASVISPGWDGIYWLKPVYVGDILSCRATVLEARPPNSKPGEGLVKMETNIYQQDGEVVTRVIGIWFLRRRPPQ